MVVVGSVIARIGSKRLTFKNIMPYKGVPLVLHALQKMLQSEIFNRVVLSTDSELIVRTCMHLENLAILKRPIELATDTTPSIPVFKHIVKHFPCDIHLNYNCNFPECPKHIFKQAIEMASKESEVLSNPCAVWAQTKACLDNYQDPSRITAKVFPAPDIFPVDIHEMDDLMKTHQAHQHPLRW